MMPDLGKYAFEVSASYAITLLALGALCVVYWLRARRVKAQLRRAEARHNA